MPKLTIEYDLDEERDDFNIVYHAIDFYCALYDIHNLLRSIEKSDIEEKYNEKLFDDIRDILSESGMYEVQ